MALISLTSAKGAPGTTTTALALLFAWPRPALLVEADMAGSSSVLAGYLRGETDHTRGLLELSLAHRQQQLTEEALWRQILQLAPERYLLPGLADPAQAAGMTATWSALAKHLTALEAAGLDVLVDAGRLGAAYDPGPLVRASNVILLVTGSRLPDIYALSHRAPALVNSHAAAAGAGMVQALVVGEGRPYTAHEIREQLSLPVLSTIAWDPVHAEVYSIGAKQGRRFDNSPLAKSAIATAARLQDLVHEHRHRLAPGTVRDQLAELNGSARGLDQHGHASRPQEEAGPDV